MSTFESSDMIPKDGSVHSKVLDIRLEIHKLSRITSKALKRAKRKRDNLINDQREALSSEKYSQQADSLLTYLKDIPSRTEFCTVTNVHTNEIETVKMNARLSPKENADLLYKKARKGLRGIAIIETRLRETSLLIGTLELVKEELTRLYNCSPTTPDTELHPIFTQLLSTLTAHGIGGVQKQPPPSSKAAEHSKTQYRHINLEGWDIFIGRTALQNDELTTRFAKPSDIWMHTATHTGSHVVIRRNKNSAWPPREILERAASFAIWYSKARYSSYTEVHVTEKRFVTKRRHSPAGQVVITRYKTISALPLSPQNYFKAHPEQLTDNIGPGL